LTYEKSTLPASQTAKATKTSSTKAPQRGYRDLHEHLADLDKQGLLVTIDRPINKDTELHPLVRWQFRGGIAEPDRKAFLFTNVVNGKGKNTTFPWWWAPWPLLARFTAWAWAARLKTLARLGATPLPTPSNPMS